MTIKCYLTGELPLTGGKVRVEMPCKSGVRGIANASQEILNLYVKYPLWEAKLHVSVNDKLIATGSFQEGPKHKDDLGVMGYEIFLKVGGNNYTVDEFITKCAQRVPVGV